MILSISFITSEPLTLFSLSHFLASLIIACLSFHETTVSKLDSRLSKASLPLNISSWILVKSQNFFVIKSMKCCSNLAICLDSCLDIFGSNHSCNDFIISFVKLSFNIL
ncbi:hypothetical protein HOF65_04425 [bacterium]|nr:hypothetical protein [bacterium]